MSRVRNFCQHRRDACHQLKTNSNPYIVVSNHALQLSNMVTPTQLPQIKAILFSICHHRILPLTHI